MASPCENTESVAPPGGFVVLQWVKTTEKAAAELASRAVVGGHERGGSEPLWVIRAKYEHDMIPGKLVVQRKEAYVSWRGKEHRVNNIQVCCARPEDITWVECRDGNVPPRALSGGRTASGEALYVGRARYGGSLIPGKIHPSEGVIYFPFGGKEISVNEYEVMCSVR